MGKSRPIAWGVGIGLTTGLVVGFAMQRMGYEFLAAGAALLTTCIVSCSVGAWLSRRQK
jgi:hypothetical protein